MLGLLVPVGYGAFSTVERLAGRTMASVCSALFAAFPEEQFALALIGGAVIGVLGVFGAARASARLYERATGEELSEQVTNVVSSVLLAAYFGSYILVAMYC